MLFSLFVCFSTQALYYLFWVIMYIVWCQWSLLYTPYPYTYTLYTQCIENCYKNMYIYIQYSYYIPIYECFCEFCRKQPIVWSESSAFSFMFHRKHLYTIILYAFFCCMLLLRFVLLYFCFFFFYIISLTRYDKTWAPFVRIEPFENFGVNLGHTHVPFNIYTYIHWPGVSHKFLLIFLVKRGNKHYTSLFRIEIIMIGIVKNKN